MTAAEASPNPREDAPQEVTITPHWARSDPEEPLPHLFAVVSWGAAATTWLAKALNGHLRILCLHAANVPLTGFRPSIHLDGPAYAHFLRQGARGYDVVGDVHGFSRYDIAALREIFADRFSAAVVVRDPLRRLMGQLAHYRAVGNGEFMDVSYIDAVIEECGLELPDDAKTTKLFVHAVNMLNSIVDERPVCPIFRSEDVTSDGEVFGELVRQISGGRIQPDPTWIATTIALRRVNAHRRNDPAFEDWELDVIRQVVWDETWTTYEELGYERIRF